MSAVKERILGAVTVMNEDDAQMLHEIETNPECHEFVSEKDAMKELGLI